VSGIPSQFAQWVRDNANRIERAEESENLPYFLRDNKRFFKPIASSLSTLELAAARHAARTPQQIEAIRSEWYERKAIRHYGQNMLRYMDGISDVDTSALSTAMNGGNVALILAEARKLKATGKEILALKRLDNPMQAAREFSMEKAATVNAAVEKKLAGWADLSLEDRQKKLIFEIQWLEDNQKYSTWRVAQRAYQKELAAVVDEIDWKKINADLATASAFKTKSGPYKSLVAQLETAIVTKNKAQAQETLAAINVKRVALEKEVARRESQKLLGDGVVTSFADDAFIQARKDKAIWCKTTQSSMTKFKGTADEVYMAAPKIETEAARNYTSGSGYINRPLRGYDGNWNASSFKGIGKVPLDNEKPNGARDMQLLTKLIDKSTYDKDVWLQRGIERPEGLQNFLQLSNLDESSVRALVGKTVTDTAFVSCGAAKGTGFGGHILNIYCPRGTKMLYIDGRSAYHSENEMLLQRSTRFRITKVERVGSKYYIDVEVVGQI
jgi:hypothetical protein